MFIKLENKTFNLNHIISTESDNKTDFFSMILSKNLPDKLYFKGEDAIILSLFFSNEFDGLYSRKSAVIDLNKLFNKFNERII